ncbi:MAG: alanyl-tRNA editing protein [Sphingomonadales bacterium]
MELLFQDDAYLKSAGAEVVSVDDLGVRLDRTIFYPTGGGQPGDSGLFRLEDGAEIKVVEARKGVSHEDVVHVLEEGAPDLQPGTKLVAEIDWGRRYRHMRFHTAMHVLCSLIEGDVTGGNLGAQKARLDFNLPGGFPDKATLSEGLARITGEDHAVVTRWITDEEMAERPELVRTMSVRPPSGAGRVRLLEIDGVDLQPCGGTHLRSTGGISDVFVSKVENKGRQNRRFTLRFRSDL